MLNSADPRDLSLRPARTDDRPRLVEIARAALFLDAGEADGLVDLFLDRAVEVGTGVVAADGRRVVGFALGSAVGDRGYTDILAVDEDVRRRGVATELLGALETVLSGRGASTLMIGGNGNRYAWPGIDTGYAGALALAASLGYAARGDALNMDVDLRAWRPGTAPMVLRHDGVGLTLRRASADDWPALGEFIEREVSTGWHDEVSAGVHRERPTVFVALRGEQFVGFAGHGLYRRGWFGPVGTSEAERGNGIGEALLRLCLDDIAAGGVVRAQISWVGPTGFYERTVGAVAGRRFSIVGKDVPHPV